MWLSSERCRRAVNGVDPRNCFSLYRDNLKAKAGELCVVCKAKFVLESGGP